MKNIISLYFRVSAIAFFLATAASLRAQWFDQGPALSITEENDAIARTDRYYTQGIKMNYMNSDNHVFSWVNGLSDFIPAWGYSVSAISIGTEIGQDIYTPANLTTTTLQTNDRPYAGWLYTGFVLQRKGLAAGKWPVLENFQMDIGVIGPDSLAANAQDWIHNSPQTAAAWHNQLKNEPGLALKYERAWLFSPESLDGPRYFDFMPHAGFSLGNVETSVGAGAMLRLGINLPDDFGPQTIHTYATTEGGYSPERKAGRYGFYVYTGADGKAVGYNAFLDGNLWQDSPSVEKEPLVGEFTGGVAFLLSRVEIDTSIFYRTHEFVLQSPRGGAYGSLTLKYKF